MVSVSENLSNNFKSIYSIFVYWQGLVQAALLRRRRETEYVDVYHERCQVCICIFRYMDERQNMWTFIMSVDRFARSNTNPIKHSLNNAMIRLLIFPKNQKEEKIGGRRRGAVWGGAICKYAALTVQVPNLGPVLWALNILNKTDTLHRVKGNPAPTIITWTIGWWVSYELKIKYLVKSSFLRTKQWSHFGRRRRKETDRWLTTTSTSKSTKDEPNKSSKDKQANQPKANQPNGQRRMNTRPN